MDISIIIPVFNGSNTIKLLAEKIDKYLKDANYSYEILFVDDNSNDASWECIKNLCSDNIFIKGLKLNSNFGQHNAIMAGLNFSKGNFIITMDDDLQHNPKYILKIVEKLKQGCNLCYCEYKNREHKLWKKVVSYIHNLILSLGTQKSFNTYASSYRGFDKDLNSKIIKNKESYIYLDILILNHNPKIDKISIIHEKRADGDSQYNFYKLFVLWFQMLKCIKLNFYNFTVLIILKTFASFFLYIFSSNSKKGKQFIIFKKINLND